MCGYAYIDSFCKLPKLVLLIGADTARCPMLEAWMAQCMILMHEYASALCSALLSVRDVRVCVCVCVCVPCTNLMRCVVVVMHEETVFLL